MIESQNRYRISTKFTLVKVFVFVGLFSVAFNAILETYNNTITLKSVIGFTLAALALTGALYFISTRKQIDYDDIKQVLYIIKKQTQTEIPVERIYKILYSSLGFHSYIIVYNDLHNQTQKVRFYPIPYDKSVNIVIADAKIKNPNFIARKWSIGLNEFLD